jgi:23S rRNA-intervening sequence protein
VSSPSELPIIQKTYDFVKWYIPILSRLPRVHKFTLGDRMLAILYELLEGFITARYTSAEKLQNLQQLNTKLDILRYQTRLLFDLNLIHGDRYEYIARTTTDIGNELGGWIKQQKQDKPQKVQRHQPSHQTLQQAGTSP